MIRRNATEMAVTNRRAVIKTGLGSRKTIEMLLNKVGNIEVSETAIGRMLGYGTIVVIGTGGTSEPFHKVANLLEFRSQLEQQIKKLSNEWAILLLRPFRLPEKILHKQDGQK